VAEVDVEVLVVLAVVLLVGVAALGLEDRENLLFIEALKGGVAIGVVVVVLVVVVMVMLVVMLVMVGLVVNLGSAKLRSDLIPLMP